MLFNKYDKVQNLKTSKTEWTIRVRAQSIWKGVNRQTQEFRGLNVIFIDDSDCCIHAFVSSKIVDLFDEELTEGRIYSLSNFHVRIYGADDNSRDVRFEKHIYFANHTKLKVEPENLINIAPYAFDLFDLHDVEKFLTDTRFLIDVVGIIRDKNINCVYSKEDKRKSYLKFQITDGRYFLHVTFFNELAKNLDKALKDIVEEPIVIFIASAKVNQYDGATCLNNYPATRFYLNVNHYSVKALKDRVSKSSLPEELIQSQEEKVPEMVSIAQIKKFTEEYIERKVRCQITVKKVNEKIKWYDYVCTSCGNEVNKVEEMYKCAYCVRNIPFPDKRFRLATICNDSTGILPIIFPDEEIQRILGRFVFKIENEVANDISFPPLLKTFEKKDYILTLKIEEKNINKSCNIYIATEINDPVEMFGNHSPSKVQTKSTKECSLSMEIDANPTTKLSPPTGKSSTKIRRRPNTENVSYEMEENVALSKIKFIKTEKV